MDVDEPITLSDYDPAWPALYQAEASRVRAALGPVVEALEHFGSTAVPGMAGKPIVDLLVGVRGLEEVAPLISAVEALGYENFGEIFFRGRLYLRRRGPPHFNLAITVKDGPFWNTQLAVRDYLRSHPDEARAYAESKREAYAQGARMFSNYSQHKGPFLAGLVQRAEAWRATRR
jgi:GrpB-like predicted nucleotidyltransferase (UPF0157 family)